MPELPWAGLLGILAMFVLPFLPDWLFEGPRTIKHRPRRHVCADCKAPWTGDHACGWAPDLADRVPGELRRLDRRTQPELPR